MPASESRQSSPWAPDVSVSRLLEHRLREGHHSPSPLRGGELAVDECLARITSDLRPDPLTAATQQRVHALVQALTERLYSHARDVDIVICGSFATGTRCKAQSRDVDAVVRFREPRPEWLARPAAAAPELVTWLRTHDLTGDSEAHEGSVLVRGADMPTLRLIPAWPDRGGPATGAHNDGRIDPVGHRDLMRARRRWLGRDTGFLALIRIVKQLAAGWRASCGEEVIGSYLIDTYALTLCKERFCLAEGLSGFLAGCAALSRRAVDDPVGVAPAQRPMRPRIASELFSHAHACAEKALSASTQHEASEAIAGMFEIDPPAEVAFRHSTSERCLA
jgi:hypothetical protein